MGGVIGLELAERRPDLVRAFVNVEGNVSLDDCTYSGRAVAYSLEQFLSGGMDAVRSEVYELGRRNLAERTYYPSLCMCDPRAFHLNGTELVAVSNGEELAGRLARLDCPHRYLLGRPRGTGPLTRDLLGAAGVDWRTIDDAGHWPFLDQPRSFLSALGEFLEEVG